METLRKLICHTTAGLFCAILILIGYAVVSRYVLNDSSTWVEEMIRFGFIWMFFLGMGEVTRTGSHLALDLLPGFLHGKARKALDIFIEVANIAFFSVMVWYSWRVALINMKQKTPALLIPYGWIYMAIPVGGVIMILFAAQRIMALAHKSTETTREEI